MKPWPSDCVIIVASRAGEAILSQMEAIHPATCRECGGQLHADTFTYRRASTASFRHGRPIEFICLQCHTNYDVSQIQILEQHNRPDDRSQAAKAMNEGETS